MRLKYKYINGQPDIKDEYGFWMKGYNSSDFVRVRTRSAGLWNAMGNRTKFGSISQRNCPTYGGCENNFIGYQEFTGWCQEQYGYMHKDTNGKYWHLDKDILVLGNKIYSPETCLFVPNRINSLFVKGVKTGLLPLGVSMTGPNKDIFSGAGGSDLTGSGSRNTKVCSSVAEAHAFWQSSKLYTIMHVIENDTDVDKHTRLKEALLARADRLKYDLDNGLETTRV